MSVARVLLPVLREERNILVGRELKAIRRKREMDVRVTCGMHIHTLGTPLS